MLIINVFVSFTSPDQQYLIYSSWSDYSKLKNSMIPKYHDNKTSIDGTNHCYIMEKNQSLKLKFVVIK